MMVSTGRKSPAATALTACLLFSVGLAGCSSDDDDTTNVVAEDPAEDPAEEPVDDPAEEPLNGSLFAFVAGQTASFDAGQIERLRIAEEGITAAGSYPATLSDIVVRTDGSNVYQVGRFQIDSITRFSPTELTTPVYQYSVNGDETAANPYDIVFVDDTKAYVIRYGSPKVWIVNPSAATEAEFKIGELDLAAYDTDAPNASDALIVDDKLFVLMQRLSEFTADKVGYVAVFDVATDSEIDTGQDTGELPGIPLTTTNPLQMAYIDELDEILVTSAGNFFDSDAVAGDPYQGGLETIDVETYARELLLDDGSDTDNLGFFTDSLVVSADKGYVLTYAGFGDTTLRTFNPLTGVLDATAVAGLESQDISVLETGPQGRIWVGLKGNNPGFTLLDPDTDAIVLDEVPTEFNPGSLVFVFVPGAEPADGN